MDYPALWGYVRELYQMKAFTESCDLAYCKKHYFGAFKDINPNKIVPLGPRVDFVAPHNREVVGRESQQPVPTPVQQKEKTKLLPKEEQRVQQDVMEKTGRVR